MLTLEDGTVFNGTFTHGSAMGEVVFTTSMTGYTEVMSDPSYQGQIVVFTYPLIGNYGFTDEHMESDKVQCEGVIISHYAENLLKWLEHNNIPYVFGIDTRHLTHHLVRHGTQIGRINGGSPSINVQPTPPKETYVEHEGNGLHTVLVDCGNKRSVNRLLKKHRLTIVPDTITFTQLMELNPDSIVLSNGPGDPKDRAHLISVAKELLGAPVPVFGICLGHQILALASGEETRKMRFGHRGSNHPVQDTNTKQGFITTQNHGYAVCEPSENSSFTVSYRNLNDNSVEGLRHKTKNIQTVQFHPEAAPGPNDSRTIFTDWLDSLEPLC